MPEDFPGFEEANRHRADPYRRVEALEASWEGETADRRFIPFIQLHEYEAYLFADISQLSRFYDDCDAKIEALRRSQRESSRRWFLCDWVRISGQGPDAGERHAFAPSSGLSDGLSA